MRHVKRWAKEYVEHQRTAMEADWRGDRIASDFWRGFALGMEHVCNRELGGDPRISIGADSARWKQARDEARADDEQAHPDYYAEFERRGIEGYRKQFPDMSEANLRRMWHGEPPIEDAA